MHDADEEQLPTGRRVLRAHRKAVPEFNFEPSRTHFKNRKFNMPQGS